MTTPSPRDREILYFDLLDELRRLHSPDDPGANSLAESLEPPSPNTAARDLIRHSRTWGSLRLIWNTANNKIKEIQQALADRDREIFELESQNLKLHQQLDYLQTDLLQSIPYKSLSNRIVKWVHRCLGEPLQSSLWERGMRIVEEAMELAQTMGVERDSMYLLVDYVNSRPTGKAPQEAAGVLVTLLAACDAMKIDIAQEVEREVTRIEHQDDKKIQDKQVYKASIHTGLIPAVKRFAPLTPKQETFVEDILQTASTRGPRYESVSRYLPTDEDDSCGLD